MEDINQDASSTNPWKDPISNITWGFVFTSFTLNFRHLQYILPTIGILMIFSGFRNLQRVNEWFRKAYILSMVRMCYQAFILVYSATPWIGRGDSNRILGLIGITFQIVFLLTFRMAIKTIDKDDRITKRRDPLRWAVVWIVLITLLGLFMIASIYLLILMILWLLYIVHSINQYSEELSHVSCDMVRVQGKNSNMVIGLGYLFACVILVFGASAFVNHLSLKSVAFTPGTDNKTRTMLKEMGFPEHILRDMSDHIIDILKDAIYVDASTVQFMMDSKYNDPRYDIPEHSDMETTTVYIEIDEHLIYVVMYFEWKNKKAYWQDGFTITGMDDMKLIDGGLLYEDGGIDYEATIPRLKYDFVTTNSWFFGARQNRKISGGVSYPFGTNHQRGYVFYRVHPPEGYWLISNSFDYLHSSHPFKLPYSETEQDIMNGIGDSKQHYTNFGLKAFREAHP